MSGSTFSVKLKSIHITSTTTKSIIVDSQIDLNKYLIPGIDPETKFELINEQKTIKVPADKFKLFKYNNEVIGSYIQSSYHSKSKGIRYQFYFDNPVCLSGLKYYSSYTGASQYVGNLYADQKLIVEQPDVRINSNSNPYIYYFPKTICVKKEFYFIVAKSHHPTPKLIEFFTVVNGIRFYTQHKYNIGDTLHILPKSIDTGVEFSNNDKPDHITHKFDYYPIYFNPSTKYLTYGFKSILSKQEFKYLHVHAKSLSSAYILPIIKGK